MYFRGQQKVSEISAFGQSGLTCSVTSPYFFCEACAVGQRDGGISVCWAF